MVVALGLLPIDPVVGQETFRVPGATAPIEIRVDRWGIPHIYAQTEYDLFFGQGFNAARDRLFQLEVWRRQATGTVAEMLGPREARRDIGTRLFMFRGDMDQELNYYHPRGSLIINAFVDGVNAYIEQTQRDPSLLSMEFELLGIRPGRWTPAVVISRHQGLLGNIGQELNFGRAVAATGPEAVRRVVPFGPGDPDLDLDPEIERVALEQDILGIYEAFRGPIDFQPEDIVPEHRSAANEDLLDHTARGPVPDRTPINEVVGSNNWVVSGERSLSGYPLMANDPHRAQAAPSLRYWVHLVGPDWNVIGGGEPEIPGVSIGHNGHGAWGLTVFATDGEDLYVYATNPNDPLEYRYAGSWERMRVIRDTIPVRGADDVIVDHKYTRHGPVVFEDNVRDQAYAVRAAWMEVGGAPYLASLRMDQAKTWEEFREASAYSHIPGENMVWAGRDGTIGWQAVGIAPIRRNWSGLVPVPGDGRYEWDGYLPIKAKPHVVNPPAGYFATANNELIPRDYPFRDAVGWVWSDPYRWARAVEVLDSGRRHSVADMMRLQTDELSIPARTLAPFLRGLPVSSARANEARTMLLDWNHAMEASSVTAGIYAAWERRLRNNLYERMVPDALQPYIGGLSLERVIDWIAAPPGELGDDPVAARDDLLIRSFEQALADLTDRLGSDMRRWQYGQEAYKHALIRHPLNDAVGDAVRRRLDVGPAPRGGSGSTLNNTGNGLNQTSGASFRIIVDTGDWDRTVGSNTPGQAGDPDHPHYRNLFSDWARNRFFPAYYSRERVEAVTEYVVRIVPN
jgi:penicillin amidase